MWNVVGRREKMMYAGLAAALVIGSIPYRKVLGQTRFKSRNLFLSDQEHKELMREGKTSVEGTEVQGFKYQKHLDDSRPTVIIEMDGPSGLILAGHLRLTGKYNIICLSRQDNLVSASSGAVPFYQKICRVYNPGLTFSECIGGTGGQRSSWEWNYLFSKLGRSVTDEQVNSAEQTNILAITPWIPGLEPTAISVDYTNLKGDTEKLTLRTFNKRYLLQAIAGSLTFSNKPDLLINSAIILRSVFSADHQKRFLGVATNLGVVLGDYYILSTESNSVEHVKKFGIQLPIHTRTYHFVDADKNAVNAINEKTGELTIAGKTMAPGEHPEKSRKMSMTIEMTADNMPVVGRVNGTPNCYLNLAHGGNTFTAGFASAECIKQSLEGFEDHSSCVGMKIDRFWLVD